MIEAWFETFHDPAKIIPAILPTEEVADLAQAAGIGADELFSIEIPGGASRHSRVRVLVNVADIADLYSSQATIDGHVYYATAMFRWRESSIAQAPVPKMLVWLRPPRPLLLHPMLDGVPAVATSRGVMAVEAVDARWLWQQRRNFDGPVPTQTSLDERWTVTGVSDWVGITDVLNDCVLSLDPLGLVDISAIVVGSTLDPFINGDRLTNLSFQPDHSIAMILDMALSAAGFVLIFDPAFDANYPFGKYVAVQIKDERTLLGNWMNQTYGKRAHAGGLEPPSGTTNAVEELMDQWVRTPNTQINRLPEKVAVLHRKGFVEAQTDYANLGSDFLLLDNAWEPAVNIGPQSVAAQETSLPELKTIPTTRARAPFPLLAPDAMLGYEPRGIAAKGDGTPVDSGIAQPSWFYTPYDTAVAALLARRAEMCWGRIGWAGWPTSMPAGAYRGTMWRFSLTLRNGDAVPMCMTEASEEDWIFGASVSPERDIRNIVFPRGNLRVNRLYNGALMMSVAPPNCRVFPARITASTRCGVSGNSYWSWTYEFEEVEPNPISCDPLVKTISFPTMYCQRRQTDRTTETFLARNLAEAGNIYVAAANSGNRIAPGVLQSAYASATIEPLPISVGTVVMMCEHYLTMYINDGAPFPPYNREYWFVMPNAVNVVCNP